MIKSKQRAVRRKTFRKLISRGQRVGVPIEATFKKYSNGHILLLDAHHPGGYEDHIWINGRATTFIPILHPGDHIRCRADLQSYYKLDGSLSVRLECVREVSVFSPEVA